MIKKQEKIRFNWFKMSNTSSKNSKKIREIKVGNVLKVDVDDPKADYDIEELAKNINIKILNKEKQNK